MMEIKIEKYIKSYLKNYTIGQKVWNYEDGCVLKGCIDIYKVTKEQSYLDYVIDYMEKYIDQDGNISRYSAKEYNIDSISSGKVLFFLYDETGNEKYMIAIKKLMKQLESHPRTKSGSFWHKNIYPNQIWLDGLYMAQPFYMTYETRINNKMNYGDILNQFKNVKKYLFDQDKKLYYHAYDESKEQPWANQETGQSPNFWIRAMGWYMMSLIDTMDEMSVEIFEDYKYYESLFKEAIAGILLYQDPKTRLFYQVIDQGSREGNYVETSGSLMIGYSILKGCRLGVLQKEKYQRIGQEIIESIAEHKLVEKGEDLHLIDICSVAGLGPGNKRDGSFLYYISEPITKDDPKASGILLMAYAELLLLETE